MITVPGTYFTKEQLEAALRADKVSVGDRTGSDRLSQTGYVYYNDKNQYDKALAWYILAARENNSYAQNNIGVLYNYGLGVPKNDMCALKWYLKAAERSVHVDQSNNIGELFETGHGVPLDKYKALEWYCHGRYKININRLEGQGYHRSKTGKKKARQQLINETSAILDAEKKKLEEKQDKTQQEMEALVDLNITYKLTGGGQNAWKDVPILLTTSKQRYTKPVNNSVTHNEELKKQTQLQEGSTSISQTKGLPSIKQEESDLQLQIKERDRQLALLRSDLQLLRNKNVTFQQQIKTNDNKINSLQRENQKLKLKINGLERQVKEKDGKNTTLQTENQSLKQEKVTSEYQLKEKDNKISSLENENRIHRTTSLTQTQKIETLNHEKATLEQNKTQANIEIDRLKASNTSLEQLLKSKEDATVSLNGENKNLSTANQFIIEMVETQKSLLQAKTNEMELLRQNMEHLLANEQRRNGALEQENRLLMEGRAQDQTNAQNTRHLHSNNNISSTHVETRHDVDNDDDNPQNDINYDTELDNTEESDDDDTEDDINYDTPSEDVEK